MDRLTYTKLVFQIFLQSNVLFALHTLSLFLLSYKKQKGASLIIKA